MRDIEFVSYDGEWPCLCHGKLILNVDGVEHVLNGSLVSGGSTWFDEGWNGNVIEGPWYIIFNDDYFSEKEQNYIIQLVNENVEFGCCGGCL